MGTAVLEKLECAPAGLDLIAMGLREVSEPKWMLQHQIDGHYPYNPKCPWCVQGKLKARKAVRKVREASLTPGGLTVAVDYSGPHPKGVAGCTYAFIGVELESDWGYVGLSDNRSDKTTLNSLQDLEVELIRDSNGQTDRIAVFHHDDDKSFRGVVEKYVRERGWVDSNTGGYNPNANAKPEGRIGMLQQLLRVVLLSATGGIMYYDQLWDVGFKYCNMILNTRPWREIDG